MWGLIRQWIAKDAPIERSEQAQKEIDLATSHLVLYHFPSCPYCKRVRSSITRLNLNITLRDIHQSAEARQELIDGGGRKTVPCLRIDDGGAYQWLYESADIISYLERRFSRSTA